jgi:hypothetical protein
MKIFVLPFHEEQSGFYYIEAESLEEAKAIVAQGDFTEDHEPYYKSGQVEWNEDKMYESEN